MLFPFPPGDMSLRSTFHQSVWREFNFAFNQVKRAIEPHLALEDMISSWNDISKFLSERPRKRNLQISRYFN